MHHVSAAQFILTVVLGNSTIIFNEELSSTKPAAYSLLNVKKSFKKSWTHLTNQNAYKFVRLSEYEKGLSDLDHYTDNLSQRV